MAYDGSYYHGIPQTQRPKAILPSNLETADSYHHVGASGYLPPLGFPDLRPAGLHLVMTIRIFKANPTFPPGARV